MAKKIKNPEIIFDFENEENLDICGFSDTPIEGNCIATFSCTSNNSNTEINESVQDQLNKDNSTTESLFANPNVLNSSDQVVNTNEVTKNVINDISPTSKSDFNNPAAINNPSELSPNDDYKLFDNRSLPIVNGCAPPIAGEYLDVKRTYMLRKSTVRKINQLKSLHPDLNTYVSTIVDLAVAFYYEHIVNDANTK
jgi:hypothetical protein